MSPASRSLPLALAAACPLALCLVFAPSAPLQAQSKPQTPATQQPSPPSGQEMNSPQPAPAADAPPSSSPHSADRQRRPSTAKSPEFALPTSAAGFLSQRINLSDTHRLWHPTRKQLGLSRTGHGYQVNAAALAKYLTGIAPYVRRKPAAAHVGLAGGHTSNQVGLQSSSVPVPAKVLPAAPGVKLNVAASVAKLKSALSANPQATHLIMSVHTTSPPGSGVDAAKVAGIDARLGHFVTRFNPGERGRTQTVRLAIKLIDSHIVQPGQTFSVNQTVGERTAQRGFGQGIVFVNGRQEKQLGGGMCQVATTLFNAALLSNLKIVQRYQHVRTVPYVKPGQDATVYWGEKDFKFENDTLTPIYISYKTTATHCICDIYGKADPSVKVSLSDTYRHLGPRHYSAVLRRYVTKNGVKTNDYTVHSAYKWTPSLDYNT